MLEGNKNSFEIDILDNQGEVIATKAYAAVDRIKDVLGNSFVFVLTPDRELLLATITEHHLSKKIYKGKLGTPTVTLLRHNEDPEKAAIRALTNDLAIFPKALTFLGKQLETMIDGSRRLMHVFYCIHDTNLKINGYVLANIRPIRRDELATLLRLNPEEFSPQFIVAYERYKRQLPF